MADRKNLTEARLAKWTASPAVAEERLYDQEVPQLVARRRPGGKVRWYLMARANGKARQVPLGDINTWPEVPVTVARELARKALVDLARSVDPVQERAGRRADHNEKVPLADVLAWMGQRMKEKGRAAAHTAERLRVGNALMAAGLRDLCDRRACAIAEAWINAQECGPLTKHRYATHVRAIGRAALKKYDDLPKDPFRALEAGSPTLPAPAMFTLPELVRLASDDALATPWGRLFGFLLFTGCRYREGAFARWSRIDLDMASFAVLPPSIAERQGGEAVKRNKSRTVTLHGELVDLLRAWKQDSAGDFLFHAPARHKSGDTTVAFREHLGRLGIPVADRCIHTLRHSHVALSVACGVSDLQLRLSVGHGGPAMSAHYASAAMLWRGVLKEWRGAFRLRDSGEVARITGEAGKAAAT